MSERQFELDLGMKDRAATTATGPVECLGEVFESDDARREHFLALLAEKLKDPEFRKTPGFPKGTDEAILRMSDPPYYTACPNPFLEEFVQFHGQPYDPDEKYQREPFAVDVSVGKTDALYKAHSYHTKVPHLAIVPSILHYTKPGDIVLDGFCGSGMTGVAAQWCGTAPDTYRRKVEREWRQDGRERPEWGTRRVILGDLSPAATFIAANYNIPFNVVEFADAARRMLDEVEDELGWMYETLHTDGESTGQINYTVWSEVFTCPECSGEVVFFEEAMDKATKRVLDEFSCPSCSALLTRRRIERRYEVRFDHAIGKTISVPKRRTVLINYSVSKAKFRKLPDSTDRDLIQRIDDLELPEIPLDKVPYMHMTHQRARMDQVGITHLHQFFTARSAHALAALWLKANSVSDHRMRNMLLYFAEQAISGMSLLNRYGPSHYSQVNKALNGVYYISSVIAEVSPKYNLHLRLNRLRKHAFPNPISVQDIAIVSTADCADCQMPSESVDYIFTDPPFGENIYYADLNFLVESWHRVVTDAKPEAIVDRAKKKDTAHYYNLMFRCFSEYYRVLKPGRWMTVVFSNSKNVIWRSIQEAMGTAGFVVADVRTLDKQQGSYRQVTSSAVKQDLVISAYKPTEALANRFKLGATTVDDVWPFVSEHLGNVPIFVSKSGSEADIIAERNPQMLHDRMIAFFVQRRVAVPISGPEFFAGLDERYPKRDGMYFLPRQISEYDRKRTKVSELRQLMLFVQDEASAIQWVRQQLLAKPQTFQDLQPQFMQQIQAWAKHEKTVELKEILDLNFLCYDGAGPVPSQIHSYLSTSFKPLRKLGKEDALLRAKASDRWYVPDPRKDSDLEKLRTRTMLKEFEEYRTSTKRKIRQFRTEAVRTGFKHCYDTRDYRTIAEVAGKLPEKVIQEDEKLLMYYDVATMRLGDA